MGKPILHSDYPAFLAALKYRILQARLPAEFKGRLPTAKQLANAMREALPSRK